MHPGQLTPWQYLVQVAPMSLRIDANGHSTLHAKDTVTLALTSDFEDVGDVSSVTETMCKPYAVVYYDEEFESDELDLYDTFAELQAGLANTIGNGHAPAVLDLLRKRPLNFSVTVVVDPGEDAVPSDNVAV